MKTIKKQFCLGEDYVAVLDKEKEARKTSFSDIVEHALEYHLMDRYPRMRELYKLRRETKRIRG